MTNNNDIILMNSGQRNWFDFNPESEKVILIKNKRINPKLSGRMISHCFSSDEKILAIVRRTKSDVITTIIDLELFKVIKNYSDFNELYRNNFSIANKGTPIFSYIKGNYIW